MTKRTRSASSTDDIAYLKAAGWTFVDKMWMDPRKDAAYHKRMGGYCNPDNAVKCQHEYERFDKGLPIYAVCWARDTYGYLLRRCDGPDKPYVTVWRHHDEEFVKTVARMRNTTNDLATLKAVDELAATQPDDHQYPYLMLCEEKHGTFRFHVPTREAFHKACLAVVKRRNKDGYWYDYDLKPPAAPALSKEAVAALPNGRIKIAAEEEWKSYEARLKQLEEDKDEAALLAKALKGDGEAAADFLKARSSGEYESFELVELDEIDA